MTPVILYYFTNEMFGLWSIFQSIVAITLLFDFGFSTTFARNINYCWSGAIKLKRVDVEYSKHSEPNFLLMKKTIFVCKKVFFLIAISAFLLLLLLGSYYISHITRNLDYHQVWTSWFIYIIGIAINLYYGYYGAFLRGIGAISLINKAIVYSRIIQMLTTIIFLYNGFGIIGTGIAYLIYIFVFMKLCSRYFYSYNNIEIELKKVNLSVKKEEFTELFETVWYNASREGVISFANYIQSQSCIIISSLFLPLSITGAYSLAVQVMAANASISSAMYVANQPVLQSAYINHNIKRIREVMSLIVVSLCIVFFLGTLCIITIGLPILKFIKPSLELSIPILLGVGVYQFILKFRNCYTSYFSCTNRIPYVKSFILSSILCIVLTVLFLSKTELGITGLIIAQIFSQIVFNAWYWAFKSHQELSLSFLETFVIGFAQFKNIIYKAIKNDKF